MDFGAISLPVLALSALLGYAVFFDPSPIAFHDVHVPPSLSYQGFTPAVFTSHLADEVRSINRRARTVKQVREFHLADGESAIDSITGHFDFLGPVRATQEMLGLVQFRIDGDVTRSGDEYLLSIRGLDYHRKRALETSVKGADPKALIRSAAIDIARFVDPYVVASYYYETARDAGSTDFTDTLRELRNCEATMPRDELHWVHNLRGLVHFHSGRPDAAIASYRRALALQPDFTLAVYNWGNALVAKGAHEEAIDRFREVVEADPKGVRAARAFTQWAVALIALKRDGDAAAMLERARDADESYADLYNVWGLLLRSQGRIAEAAEMFDRAVGLLPGRADFQANLQSVAIN
ncbi:tetratricopeptide repeat protein [Azospirillum halopraeferens]|uniref:tetratricopeptide repeat protein n=1 Tax=Azospirillum halopraeferens TaxID=34010 RepID=UPI0003FA1778|nr:tetratricopeptide repeat protein [Azospirillum halopraeferens]